MTTKDTNKDGTRTDALSGPAVSFGYETNSSAQQDAGTNLAYHVSSPELILPGLKAIQSPITSRSGNLERTGHRITGACTFYIPSLSYIKSLPEFSETTQFDELETYDKLLDMERIIIGDRDSASGYTFDSSTSSSTMSVNASSTNNKRLTVKNTLGESASASTGFHPSAHEIDRFQFRIKRSAAAGTSTAYINIIKLVPVVNNYNTNMQWEPTSGNGAPLPTSEEYVTIDVPFNVKVGSTTLIYIGGTGYEYTLNYEYPSSSENQETIREITGYRNSNSDEAYLSNMLIGVQNTGDTTVTVTIDDKNSILYKEAEWRVESIKDYRDEYMEVKAVRVRGDRASRRRAYG